MASFNRVILAGNLTRDPQLQYLPSNTPVCKFGMAISRKFRDKDNNQREEVCFVDLSAFGRTGEMINQYFQKGRPILVEGRLQYREWTSQEGQKRSKLEVVVDQFSFIDSGQGRGGQGGAAPARGYQAPSQESEPGPGPMDDMGPPPENPDIPF